MPRLSIDTGNFPLRIRHWRDAGERPTEDRWRNTPRSRPLSQRAALELPDRKCSWCSSCRKDRRQVYPWRNSTDRSIRSRTFNTVPLATFAMAMGVPGFPFVFEVMLLFLRLKSRPCALNLTAFSIRLDEFSTLQLVFYQEIPDAFWRRHSFKPCSPNLTAFRTFTAATSIWTFDWKCMAVARVVLQRRDLAFIEARSKASKRRRTFRRFSIIPNWSFPASGKGKRNARRRPKKRSRTAVHQLVSESLRSLSSRQRKQRWTRRAHFTSNADFFQALFDRLEVYKRQDRRVSEKLKALSNSVGMNGFQCLSSTRTFLLEHR